MHTLYLDLYGITSPFYDRLMELRKEGHDDLEEAEDELAEAIYGLDDPVEFINERLVSALGLCQGPDINLAYFRTIRRVPHSSLCRCSKFVRTLQVIDDKNYNFDRPLAFYEFCKTLKIGKRTASYLYDEPNEGIWGLFYELKKFVQSKSKKKQLYIETND